MLFETKTVVTVVVYRKIDKLVYSGKKYQLCHLLVFRRGESDVEIRVIGIETLRNKLD